jgi:pyruvate dehydrogenase E1 component alpha subunit
MSAKDILVPNFRQHGSLLFRGLSLYDFFVYWKGYEDGLVSTKKMNSTPYIVPVSTHLVHAVGIAFTHKYLGTGASVLTYVGDGGTSEGDFYEALNFAGVMKVPIVFVIENNQWAISTPVRKQTAASTLAQKGIAAGMVCTQVDGNDVMAVYKATKESLANTPKGPSLIECLTYRLSFHTTSDDPTKYRTEAEVEDWKKRDPIKRVRLYLESKQLWNASKQQTMEDEQLKTINGAVSKADTFKPDPKSMFETLYSSIPDTLKDEETDALNSGFWQEGTNPV